MQTPGADAAIARSDYLCDEVLAPAARRIREFLLRTCVTETVTGDLADALTGDPAAAARWSG